MDLLKALLYRRLTIENYDLETLKNILLGRNEHITIKNINHGSIVLKDHDNHKMIKCIEKYYVTQNNERLTPTTKNNFCWSNRMTLHFLHNVKNFDCANCHLKCIELYNDGSLRKRK